MFRSPSSLGLCAAILLVATAKSVDAADPTAAELGLMKGFAPKADRFVDGTNWVIYPLNKWGFQNVRRFLPTAPLVNESGNTIPFPFRPVDLDGLEIEESGGKSLTEVLEFWNNDSIVVTHHGELVYERYWNGMSPRQPHWLASASKSYIGTVAAILVDRGVLDRDGPIESYIPELAGSGFAGATVGQMLDMTAGTAWDESPEQLVDTTSFARQYGAASGMWGIEGVRSTGVASFLPSITNDRPHGESFVYNSPQVDALGWAVANATRQPVDVLMSEMIWSRLGPECEGYYLLDGGGVAFSTGGMVLCARDVARFGQMILNGGYFGGKQVVPDSVVAKFFSAGDVEAFAKGSHADVYPGGAYRDYWWVTNNADDVIMAKGIYGQYIYINPAKKVVIARQASEKISADKRRFAEIEAAFQAIADHLAVAR